MKEAFGKCQDIMKNPHSLIVPWKDDKLVKKSDRALHLSAIGSILMIFRTG